jgi:hypothetical protein
MGTIIIPPVKCNGHHCKAGTIGSAWLRIDREVYGGQPYPDSILQAGVGMCLDGGVPTYVAWYVYPLIPSHPFR